MRSVVFWALDNIKGKKVKKIYNKLKKDYENINYDEQKEKLKKLIEYANESVPYYRNIGKKEIKELPIINKKIIIDNYESFKSNKYKEDELHQMFTSGSTGTPFTILQNKSKRNSVLAEIIYYGEICGFEFGSKQVYYRVWTDKLKKSKFQSFKQNLLMTDISNLNNNKLKDLAEELKNKKVKSILAFASTLDALSIYLEKEGYTKEDFVVKSIISSSEILQDETRKRLKKIFGCNVVSRYSNQENGILGQDCLEEKEFHLNESDYYFEFLKLNSDEPVVEGELGRVIVTDLNNKAMPMIRYDTGDTAIYSEKSKCGIKGKVIKEIYGRKMDIILNTKGEKISPFVLSSNLVKLDVVQFKFIQKSNNQYEIQLNCNKKPNNLDLVIFEIKQFLGQDAKINVEYVDEIPILASGKRKYIENLSNIN